MGNEDFRDAARDEMRRSWFPRANANKLQTLLSDCKLIGCCGNITDASGRLRRASDSWCELSLQHTANQGIDIVLSYEENTGPS